MKLTFGSASLLYRSACQRSHKPIGEDVKEKKENSRPAAYRLMPKNFKFSEFPAFRQRRLSATYPRNLSFNVAHYT